MNYKCLQCASAGLSQSCPQAFMLISLIPAIPACAVWLFKPCLTVDNTSPLPQANFGTIATTKAYPHFIDMLARHACE